MPTYLELVLAACRAAGPLLADLSDESVLILAESLRQQAKAEATTAA